MCICTFWCVIWWCACLLSLSLILFFFFCSSVGPAFWGLINPQWNMCSKGRRQSPIDIEPDKLLFDPYLRPLHIDKHKVSPINYLKNGYLMWSVRCTKNRIDRNKKKHTRQLLRTQHKSEKSFVVTFVSSQSPTKRRDRKQQQYHHHQRGKGKRN